MRSHHVPAAALSMILMAILLVGGCSSSRPTDDAVAASPESIHPLTAVADLSPIGDNTVRGTVTLTREPGGTHIVANIEGLGPGDHAFDILETGQCPSYADSTAALLHFNPTGAPHGAPDAASRHLGDLGNLTADPSGNAHYDRVDAGLSLEGPTSVVGHVLVVRAGADHPAAQPDGNAGPRTACAVITLLHGSQ